MAENPLRIDARVLLEPLDRQVEPRGAQQRVLVEQAAHAAVVLQVGLDGTHPVHVDREADVARLGQPLGLGAHVVAVAPAAVNDDHARPRLGVVVIPGNQPLHFRVAVCEMDHLGFHARGRRGLKTGQQQDRRRASRQSD